MALPPLLAGGVKLTVTTPPPGPATTVLTLGAAGTDKSLTVTPDVTAPKLDRLFASPL